MGKKIYILQQRDNPVSNVIIATCGGMYIYLITKVDLSEMR